MVPADKKYLQSRDLVEGVDRMPPYDFHDGFKQLKGAKNGTGDRVPVFAQLHEFAMKWNGISGKIFYTSPEIYVKGILDMARAFEIDTPDIGWDVYHLEAEALGAKVFFYENQSPALDQSKPLIENEKDLAKLKTPDPYSSGRFPFALDCLHIFKKLTGVPSPITFCAPFSLAALLVGYEKLVMAIYERPDFVKKVLHFLTEAVIAPFIQAAFKEFEDCPSADGADALASLPFLTQDMLDEFCIPYILRLKKICGRDVSVKNWWGDSYAKDLDRFWNQKLAVSPGVLEVQDPDLFKIGPERAMDFARQNDLSVIFGVDQRLLAEDSIEEVENRVKTYIRTGAKHKKFVLYLCNLNRDTPEGNIKAAIKAAKKFGRYNT
jgi:uroporphyrinogen-III decarboxylase